MYIMKILPIGIVLDVSIRDSHEIEYLPLISRIINDVMLQILKQGV